MYWADTNVDHFVGTVARMLYAVLVHYLLPVLQLVLKNGPRHDAKAICEAPVKPLFNKPYRRESCTRCSLLTLIPRGLSGYFKALSASDGFPRRSHWDSTNLTQVLSGPTQGFYSWAQSDPAMCMQNPSLLTTPHSLSYTVICATWDKTALNSREPCYHSHVYFYVWKKKTVQSIKFKNMAAYKHVLSCPSTDPANESFPLFYLISHL